MIVDRDSFHLMCWIPAVLSIHTSSTILQELVTSRNPSQRMGFIFKHQFWNYVPLNIQDRRRCKNMYKSGTLGINKILSFISVANCIYTLGWEEGEKRAKHLPRAIWQFGICFLYLPPLQRQAGAAGCGGQARDPTTSPWWLQGCWCTCSAAAQWAGGHKTVTGRSCSSCVSKAIRSLWTSWRMKRDFFQHLHITPHPWRAAWQIVGAEKRSGAPLFQ